MSVMKTDVCESFPEGVATSESAPTSMTPGYECLSTCCVRFSKCRNNISLFTVGNVLDSRLTEAVARQPEETPERNLFWTRNRPALDPRKQDRV